MDKQEGLKWVFHWGLFTFHFPHHYLFFFFFSNFAQLTLKRFPFARFPPPTPLFLCVLLLFGFGFLFVFVLNLGQ